MPIYEFECPRCENRFEELSAVGTTATDCPECGAGGAERRMSMFAYSRQATANQRRRMEDARGTNRDGARTRWKTNLERGRKQGGVERRPPKKSGD